MGEGSVFIGNFSDRLYVKIKGDLTMRNASSLESFFESADMHDYGDVIFDMEGVRYLDSTAIGIVTHYCADYMNNEKKKAVLLNLPKAIDKQFRHFALNQISDFINDDSLSIADDLLVSLPLKDEMVSAEKILSAHKSLASLSVKNKETFQVAIEQLEKSLGHDNA